MVASSSRTTDATLSSISGNEETGIFLFGKMREASGQSTYSMIVKATQAFKYDLCPRGSCSRGVGVLENSGTAVPAVDEFITVGTTVPR
jgi:hypothetical protein